MLVYCKHPTPRFEYISRYLLETLCGFSINITGDKNSFNSHDGPVIYYDNDQPDPNAFHISPSGLLNEDGIKKQDIKTEGWRGHTIFFVTNGKDIPFDIFSSAFYLISRYEEYLPHEKDIYGRYSHKNSLAFTNDFLQIPLVNCLAIELRKLLLRKFPVLVYQKRAFCFVPTYDIDMAWTYLHKGLLRNMAGFARSVRHLNWKQVVKRISVLRGKRKDPYDVYEWLDALHLRYSLKPNYFFLMAKEVKGYDTNISPDDTSMKDLVSYHSMGYPVGIHPSWQSGDQPDLLNTEIRELEKITGKTVTNSRFHFIRFSLPDSYRRLIAEGIQHDFSMGYGDINGFRASVSTPFQWYDLESETSTALTVHPFCWMDANSYYEQEYTPAQAFQELKSYHDMVKSSEGDLCIISHNSFFSDEPGFAGWKLVYEIFLDEVVYWDL
jgi:hypothetical protein